MKSESTIEIHVSRYENGKLQERKDILAIEEPLEIKMKYFSNGLPVEKNISITMRTPGNDEELSCGFIFTEELFQILHK